MRNVVLITILSFLSICSYSQEHIKFNGATFGKPLTEFIKGFPQNTSVNSIEQPPRGFDPNLCNHKPYDMLLNAEWWHCHVFSSRITNTVFRTVSVNSYWKDLESKSMLIVKTLEEKYGGGIQEKRENLGEVGYYGTYQREMLALYYYIRNTQGRTIGEIRVSVAPEDKEAKSGYIEISYTDYSAQKKATTEYNSMMRDAF